MLWSLCALALASTQTVDIVVSGRGLPAGTHLFAETTWLGQARRTLLSNNGGVPADLPGDGLLATSWTGKPVRTLGIRIVAVHSDGTSTVAWSGIPDMLGDHDRFAFAVGSYDPLRLERIAATPLGSDAPSSAIEGSLAGAAWGALVFGYVLSLLPRRSR